MENAYDLEKKYLTQQALQSKTGGIKGNWITFSPIGQLEFFIQ
jgi:hypothetical protein